MAELILKYSGTHVQILFISMNILRHLDPFLGNELTNTFLQRLILGNQIGKEHISMDMSDQQTFPWIPKHCIRGHSDQNEVSCKSAVSRTGQVLGSHLL